MFYFINAQDKVRIKESAEVFYHEYDIIKQSENYKTDYFCFVINRHDSEDSMSIDEIDEVFDFSKITDSYVVCKANSNNNEELNCVLNDVIEMIKD